MITLELPWPVTQLWPNRNLGRDWRWRHGHKAAALEAAYWPALAVRAALAPPLTAVPVEYTFCPPTRRAFDLDGAYSAAKAMQDGIAKALGVDDRVFEPVTLRRGPVVAGGCVRVKIGA